MLNKQPPRLLRAYLYDIEADPSEYASLNNIVKIVLQPSAIFHLHGAVGMEPPLLCRITTCAIRQTCCSRKHQED